MATADDVARRLVDARRTHQPASLPDAELDDEAAYAVQALVGERLHWFDGPWSPRHWKSGGPSRNGPLTHAPLPPAGVWASPAQALDFPLRERGIEAEIAWRLGRAVSPALAAAVDGDAAIDLFDAMGVSIEVVDSRWSAGLQAPAWAKLADLQSHGALVLGDWVPVRAIDWLAQRCRVAIGRQPVVEVRGSHALGDPRFGLATWLRHATRDGRSLDAGSVVTTGTWVGILPAHAGDRVEVGFPGIGQAVVQL